jgi:hypothetical protein
MLNIGIVVDDVCVLYDTLHGPALHVTALQACNPGKVLVVWKSNMQGAYHVIPKHCLWRRKQLVCINGAFYHNQCETLCLRLCPIISNKLSI